MANVLQRICSGALLAAPALDDKTVRSLPNPLLVHGLVMRLALWLACLGESNCNGCATDLHTFNAPESLRAQTNEVMKR
jgi:hypothetical protein